MISTGDVKNLAELARLELSDAETASLQKDISSILDYVKQVDAVSTMDASASHSPLKNVMRDDMPRAEGDPLAQARDALLEAFPEREGDYNVVRKVIEK